MSSEVNWLVLGLLIERPGYGHELYHRYERTYGAVRPVSTSSHIYTALDVLVERGLAEKFDTDIDLVRQPKIRHRATHEGVDAYEGWVVGLIDVERRRHEMLARQLGIFARSPAVGLRILDLFEGRCLERAGRLGEPESHPPNSRDELIGDLVSERLRIASGGTLSWLRYARERIETFAGGHTG